MLRFNTSYAQDSRENKQKNKKKNQISQTHSANQ